jgi:hypothetical protein
MERKKGNITTLMLGPSTCSESRLSRLISHLRQATVIGFSAMTLLILAFPAQGDLINGSFETVGSSHTSSFAIANAPDLPGWTASGDGYLGILDCVVFPGTITTKACDNPSPIVKMWSGPAAAKDGVNFVAFDGGFNLALSQTLTGLVKNQSYTVSFWQGAAQQDCPDCGTNQFSGDTVDNWIVSLGTETPQSSPTMNNLSHGFVDWGFVSLTFTAQGPIETLKFLALGVPGGDPPFLLLDGVSVTSPEPATYAFMGIGLLGVLAARRQLKKRS